MATTQNKYMEMRQQRDFGDVLNATFEFLSSNFGNFFKVIFTIVGPFFILATTVLGLFGYRLLNKLIHLERTVKYRYGNPDELMNVPDALLLTVSFLALMLGMLALYLSIFGYIKCYVEKRSGEITVAEVLQFVKSNAMRFFGSSLVLLFMFGIIISIIVLIVVAGAGGMGGLFIFFIVMAMFAILIYQSLFFAILSFEDVNPIEAILRGFQIISGHWWFTFGILMVLGVLNTIINSLVQYSATALIEVVGYNSFDEAPSWLARIGFVSFGVLVGVMYIVVSSISIIKDAVLYFSFVETKESVGLMEKIQSLGSDITDHDQEIKIERSKQQYTNEETDEDF
jgi:hypothetical protein